jgi:upstream activation factor subunit UAF30
MARTEIVSALWKYIRTHNLQNPSNKQEIFLDEALRAVFGCKVFTMFTINKYISAHVHPYKPVDLTPTPKTPSKRKSPGSAKSGASSGKKRKSGTQPPYRLSDALEVVVGTDILPRPQVVSKLWVYIRAHDLQNPKDKREILCDSALRKVFGGKAKGKSHVDAQGCCSGLLSV